MGSKSRIVEKLIKHFPSAKNFYDLFGGGFSMTHAMIENRKSDYQNFNFNEIKEPVIKLIKDAMAGKYSYENFKPKFIEREEFFKKKDDDFYIASVWSFGNNPNKGYLFGKNIENEKRSMHNAVVFGDFDEWFKNAFKFCEWHIEGVKERRLYLKKRIREIYPDCGERHIVNGKSLQQLQQLQQLERLQELEQLEKKISFSSLDYRQVEIKKDSVIYCDIPYFGTADYGNSFSHLEFFGWASEQSEPVFISEYNIDDDRFSLIAEVELRSTLSATSNSKKCIERLYGNKAAMEKIKDGLFLC
jgi:site-specific DNA-adenine methylase